MSHTQTVTKIYDDCKYIVNSSETDEKSVEPSSLRKCSIISEIPTMDDFCAVFPFLSTTLYP